MNRRDVCRKLALGTSLLAVDAQSVRADIVPRFAAEFLYVHWKVFATPRFDQGLKLYGLQGTVDVRAKRDNEYIASLYPQFFVKGTWQFVPINPAVANTSYRSPDGFVRDTALVKESNVV